MSEQAGDRGANQAQRVTVDQFRPRAMARVKKTEVLRAKYPAVDAHNHYNDRMDLQQVVDTMDECNIRLFVDLSGYSGDRLKRRLELLKGRYPERFAVFYVPEFERIAEPDFGEREAHAIAQAKRDGAQGVKVFKSLGLSVRDADGTLVHVDDRRLDPVWQTAGELGLPVMIHVADPWAFFEPLDEHNERYLQLVRHPDWHFYGGDYPTLWQLLEERDRVLERHPGTKFIGAHVGTEDEDLDMASALLDRCPNYYVDPSARMAELGRQPRRVRRFFIEYADRILFGTDGGCSFEMYRDHFRWLETDDECMEPWLYPQHGFWLISGLDLPDDVLRKIYVENAPKVIPGI